MSSKTKDTDPDFIQRMHEIVRKMGGQNALSRASGVSLGSIQKALSGSEPTRMNLIRLAQASGVTLSWLAEGEKAKIASPTNQADFPPIPVKGLAEDGKKGWFKSVSWEIHCDLNPKDPNSFTVIAPNNQLAPEGIKSGFACITSPATIPEAGDIVFIERHDGQSALRLLQNISDKEIHTRYYGEDHEPHSDAVSRTDIRQMSTVLFVKRRL